MKKKIEFISKPTQIICFARILKITVLGNLQESLKKETKLVMSKLIKQKCSLEHYH